MTSGERRSRTAAEPTPAYGLDPTPQPSTVRVRAPASLKVSLMRAAWRSARVALAEAGLSHPRRAQSEGASDAMASATTRQRACGSRAFGKAPREYRYTVAPGGVPPCARHGRARAR